MTIGQFLTTAEASALLTIPVATLRWYRHAGKGPRSFRLGSAVRYDKADLERWVAAQRAATSSGGNG